MPSSEHRARLLQEAQDWSAQQREPNIFLPYDNTTQRVEITPEQRYIGEATREIFKRKIKRNPPWTIEFNNKTGEADIIVRHSSTPNRLDANPLYRREDTNRGPIWHLRVEGLKDEVLPPEFVQLSAAFQIVEQKLPDYMRYLAESTRQYHGINMAARQWLVEEAQHDETLGLVQREVKTLPMVKNEQGIWVFTQTQEPKRGVILSPGIPIVIDSNRPDRRTPEEIQEDNYYENLAQVWLPPFKTDRKMSIYGLIQEPDTESKYGDKVDFARSVNAPITAEAYSLIRHDEAFHGGGYNAIAYVFHEVDPEGTIQDIIDVGSKYKAPALNQIPGMSRLYRKSVHMGIIKTSTEEVLIKTLKGLDFVTDEILEKVISGYRANLRGQKSTAKG